MMTENENKETNKQEDSSPDPKSDSSDDPLAISDSEVTSNKNETNLENESLAPEGNKTPEEELAELKDKLLRSLAENENLIRRARRDREDANKYAATNFARDMLGVADNLRRALDAVPASLDEEDDSIKGFLEGVALTERELLGKLERHGIIKISPMGEKFNHDHHEALFEVPSDEVDSGTVIQVVEDGYIIHDRLLRAAKVGVSKVLSPPEDDDDNPKNDISG